MSRYHWSDTLEPVLGEGIEAEEDIQQLGRKLGKLAEEGAAMPAVEMDGFVVGLQVLPEVVPAPEWVVHVWGCEDDHGAAEPPHPSLRYRGDGQRELAVQEPILIRQARTAESGQDAQLRAGLTDPFHTAPLECRRHTGPCTRRG